MRTLRIAFALLLALTCAAPAQFGLPLLGSYPIQTPQSLGTTNTNRSCTTSDTQTLTTTNAVLAGDTLVVTAAQFESSSITVSSISDGTNSYSKVSATTTPNGGEVELWEKLNASAVASGATLTVTYSGSSLYCIVNAARVSGAVGTLDVSPTGTNGTTGQPSISSGTLAQAQEALFGMTLYYYNGTAMTYTEATGFTTLATAQDTHNGSNSLLMTMSYKLTNSTSSVTYNPTLTNQGDWAQLMASYK